MHDSCVWLGKCLWLNRPPHPTPPTSTYQPTHPPGPILETPTQARFCYTLDVVSSCCSCGAAVLDDLTPLAALFGPQKLAGIDQ